MSSPQFSAWVDAVIFVFSLENEASFNAIYAYYTKMSHYRNAAEIPIILVGTQGKNRRMALSFGSRWIVIKSALDVPERESFFAIFDHLSFIPIGVCHKLSHLLNIENEIS